MFSREYLNNKRRVLRELITASKSIATALKYPENEDIREYLIIRQLENELRQMEIERMFYEEGVRI